MFIINKLCIYFKMVETLYCSPYNQQHYAKQNETCYSLKNLRDIAKEYNKLNINKISLKQSKKKLHEALEEAFQDICKNELCWINNNLIKNKQLIESSFRPLKPIEWYDDKDTWLNTYDILFVMQQYEKLYRIFKFIGVYPINFRKKINSGRCIGDDLCNFTIDDILLKNKSQFSIILNLDEHDEPGSHWVSIFCNLNPKKENFGIYYYDSVANDPPSEVIEFMNVVESQVLNKFNKNISNKFKNMYNRVQKQFANSECGMFVIIFNTQMLKNIPFDFICKHMKTDDEINKLRDIIYHPSK